MIFDDPKQFYAELGRRINKARRNRRVAQEDLAGQVGISRPSLVNIEKGRQRSPLHVICRIAASLELGIEDIVPEWELPNNPMRGEVKELRKDYRTFANTLYSELDRKGGGS